MSARDKVLIAFYEDNQERIEDSFEEYFDALLWSRSDQDSKRFLISKKDKIFWDYVSELHEKEVNNG